jgi:hypothetical protein
MCGYQNVKPISCFSNTETQYLRDIVGVKINIEVDSMFNKRIEERAPYGVLCVRKRPSQTIETYSHFPWQCFRPYELAVDVDQSKEGKSESGSRLDSAEHSNCSRKDWGTGETQCRRTEVLTTFQIS